MSSDGQKTEASTAPPASSPGYLHLFLVWVLGHVICQLAQLKAAEWYLGHTINPFQLPFWQQFWWWAIAVNGGNVCRELYCRWRG